MELYNVRGDHPINLRVDKFDLPENEVGTLVTELLQLGYENVKVEKVLTEKVKSLGAMLREAINGIEVALL